MTCLTFIEEHLGMGFGQSFKTSSQSSASPEAKRVQSLLNRMLKRDFYILGPIQETVGKCAIRQLKLFLSSKRIDSKPYKFPGPAMAVPFYFVHPH